MPVNEEADKKYKLASEWYALAADSGDRRAMLFLGNALTIDYLS